MGWFWSSTSPEAAASSPSTSSSSSSSSPTTPSSSQTSSHKVSQQSPLNSSNRDSAGQDDAELDKFMAMLQGSGNSVSTDSNTQTASPQADETPSKLAAWKAVWPGSSAEEAAAPEETYVARERSLAEAVLPVQMSCRQAFDMAWACQSPAGQWRAVYRHGGVRPCSELWDDFWFCMRVKGYGEGPLKEEAVREHYRKKEMDKYYKPNTPSSEDVWRSRTVDEVLAPGTVFQNSFQAVLKRAEGPVEMTAASAPAKIDDGREDASQILADAERRQRIRKEMGYAS